MVDDQFEEVLDEIHETKPNFKIVYDQVLPVHQDKYDEMHKVEFENKFSKISKLFDTSFMLDFVWFVKFTFPENEWSTCFYECHSKTKRSISI